MNKTEFNAENFGKKESLNNTLVHCVKLPFMYGKNGEKRFRYDLLTPVRYLDLDIKFDVSTLNAQCGNGHCYMAFDEFEKKQKVVRSINSIEHNAKRISQLISADRVYYLTDKQILWISKELGLIEQALDTWSIENAKKEVTVNE